MTDGYAPLDVTTSYEAILEDILAELEEAFPGWVPRDTHLEVRLAAAIARRAAETNTLIARRADNLFRFLGEKVDDVQPVTGARAVGRAQLTTVDDSGWNVPRGTVLGVRITGDEIVTFTTDRTVTVRPGQTTGTVTVTAEEIGSDGNDLTGPLEIVDSLPALQSASLLEATAGGRDAETDAEYLDRLASRRALAAEVPILPGDFPPFAREIPGVRRAVAIDGYNPTDGTSGNARTVTVAVVDPDGLPVSQAVADAVRTDLAGRREVNFVVHVIEPTYTPVHVALTVRPAADWSGPAAAESAAAAVAAFLAPSAWGSAGAGDATWQLRTKVRYLEVAAVASAADGVDFLESLTLNGTTADVTLDGPAPLPAPQTAPAAGDPWTEATTVTGSHT